MHCSALRRVFVVVSCALGLVVLAHAQTPAPSPPPGGQQPTFTSGVTLVTTDAIPHDASGAFVADLKKEDFEILEDGVRQTITSFVLVHGGRTFNLEAAPPPVPEGIVLPTGQQRKATDDTTGRVLLILVDDLHFEALITPHVRQLILKIAATLLHEGDLVAMVSTGPSAIEVNLTFDRKRISEAVTKVRGSAPTYQELMQSPDSSQGPGDLRRSAQTAFYTAYNIINELEQVRDRRKAVLFISTGYDFDPYAEGRLGRDRIQGGRFAEPIRYLRDEENPYFMLPTATADIELYALMRELTRSANRANATIYTLDPRGLPGVVDAGQNIDQSEWRTFIQKTQSTLRYIAEETGGFAVVNDNDVEPWLKKIDAETSDYYVLGYYPTNADPTKRVREIQVKTTRPAVTVSSRRTYSLKPPGKATAPAASKKSEGKSKK